MWAVLPIKDFADAKQRLAGVLSPEERRRLFAAMLDDVLSALSATPGLDGIAVVAKPGSEGAGLAERFGARLIAEPENRGQTEAVAHAADVLSAEGTAGMVVVPGDVPLLSATELAQVLAAHGSAPAMTIVPSRNERGSNCVVCSPPDSVPLRFGADSFFPHLAAARRRGIAPRIERLPGLALDIDTPEDLAALRGRPARTRTHAVLAEDDMGAMAAAELSA